MINTKESYKLAHFISSCGFCSRRKAEEYISMGSVKVNGVIVQDLATRVSKDDSVQLGNQILTLINQPTLVSFYKPAYSLVSRVNEGNKTTIFDLLPSKYYNFFSVGRLDYMSEGLLLLTNSNALCSELMHSDLKREYKVLLDRYPAQDERDFVTQAFTIDGINYRPWKLKLLPDNWILLTLTEGKNREIRKTCAFLDLQIKRLIRVKYGKYTLNGKPGDITLEDIS